MDRADRVQPQTKLSENLLELALVNGAGAVRISRFERGLDLRVLLRMDLARRPARTGDIVVSS